MSLFAQGTAFTYQGRLNDGTNPATGNYDLQFFLRDTSVAGNPVGATNTLIALGVTNGLFTATLDFGVGIFTGADRWLEVGVRTNGGGDYTPLSPRQKLTPTPYAIAASNLTGTLPVAQLSGTLPGALLSGTYGSAITLSNAANSFAGSGAGLTGVNAATLGDLGASSFWQLGGNAGTTPGANFLGTTDNQPLELKVNGQRALRLEPTTNSPNVIGGFEGNSVNSNAVGVTISGGGANDLINVVDLFHSDYRSGSEPHFATIGGGAGNSIYASSYDIIAGGASNSISTKYANGKNTISGGALNRMVALIVSSTIGGGEGNQMDADTDSVFYSTIGGGQNNRIDAFPVPVGYDTIAGGYENHIRRSSGASIGGGTSNSVIVYSDEATIAGGAGNMIDGFGYGAAIGGGQCNLVKAKYGTIPGGDRNVAAERSFAAGSRAKANHQGAFVWSDSSDFDFASSNEDQFSARCVGGARFVSGIDADGIPTAGVELVPGGGSWSSLSDRNAKENFASISPREVLEGVNRMPITTWNYKTQDAAIRHIGPMAQDFAAAFQVGENDRRITTVDADGVALAAIQGLNQKVEEQRAENAELKQRLEKLEQLMNQKNGGAK